MPYQSVSEATKKHPNLKKYSPKAQRGWVKSFNSAYKNYKDESKAFAVAYSVSNKIDGKKKASEEPETIFIDFDNTIVEDNYPEIGKLKNGVKESLDYLKNMGYKIVIYTCRTNKQKNKDADEQRQIIDEFLKKNAIIFDEIAIEDKPFFKYIIDDKAIRFDNDWNDVLNTIELDRVDEQKITEKIVKSYENRIW